jgi:methylenetetrahydrofolate dehydrogenase (NADP+)/methenyltetrahydrofolate cyclohydrolase
MTAVRMDGKVLAEQVRVDVAREVADIGHVGLATVLVGDDEASHVYIAAKHKAATEAGIDARDVRLPADTSEEDVLALVDQLNNDPDVDGILVQLPLPSHMSETKVTYAVSPAKDVDGFHPMNAGNLYLGTPIHVPATPSGCMELLRAYGFSCTRTPPSRCAIRAPPTLPPTSVGPTSSWPPSAVLAS